MTAGCWRPWRTWRWTSGWEPRSSLWTRASARNTPASSTSGQSPYYLFGYTCGWPLAAQVRPLKRCLAPVVVVASGWIWDQVPSRQVPPFPSCELCRLFWRSRQSWHFLSHLVPINPILHTWFRDNCFTYDGSSTIQVYLFVGHFCPPGCGSNPDPQGRPARPELQWGVRRHLPLQASLLIN